MEQAFSFVMLLVFYPCVFSKPLSSDALQQNLSLATESVDGHDEVLPVSSYSWAIGNQSCSSLLRDCIDYLRILPPSSSQFVKPALLLGLKKIGCLVETDQLYMDLIQDERTREMLVLLNDQMKTSVLQTPSHHHHKTPKHAMKFELLKFNLDSLLPSALPVHYKNCSGFHEKENVFLDGLYLGVHKTIQEAEEHCTHLGPACAGVSSSNTSGKFYCVARNGAYIMPQKGANLWLHNCNAVYLRRRSTDPECTSEKEQSIHKVFQWIPVVGGWYNAGSAIYYARQGCSVEAEDRAVQAAVDLGYDALLATTGGATAVVGAGVGMAVKPALKQGVRAVISYFKGEQEQ
ncbi:apolipoprotein F [Hyperolius riggenbachi]|uniref:apolipoprotein F n=1 Tax=Hyperolius riggenbachi TaxID=752182 RepID=UPI0035A35B7F